MESVGDDANSVLHENQKFFKSDTFQMTQVLSLSKMPLLKFHKMLR